MSQPISVQDIKDSLHDFGQSSLCFKKIAFSIENNLKIYPEKLDFRVLNLYLCSTENPSRKTTDY